MVLSKITNNLIKIKILELKGWGGTGQSSDRQLDYLNLPNFLRGASELKNVTKSGTSLAGSATFRDTS